VIIAGFGRFGQICARLLEAEGVHPTVLEADSDQVDLLRRFGRKVFYGDASRHDLLETAGAAEARLLILALDRPEKTLELVHTAKKHFPGLTLLARARGRVEAYELVRAGVDHVYRETFDSALRMGADALRLLGSRAHRAHRAASRFRRFDEALLRELAQHREEEGFMSFARQRYDEVGAILRRDLRGDRRPRDAGWDTEGLRRSFGGERAAADPEEGAVS
jgi:voltage-gated potassium channel Kch